MPERKSKDEMLQVQVPPSTKRDLAVKAAKAGEPLRMYVLKALAAYGVKVPAGEIADRRKSKS
jgi:predicted HicB family RNase H-like nuclease